MKMTFEELECLPDNPEKLELLEGELIRLPVPTRQHISESNTAAEIDAKVCAYMAHGAREVWLVYPKSRSWVEGVTQAMGRSLTVAVAQKTALFIIRDLPADQ